MKKIIILTLALGSIIGAKAQEYVDLGLSVNWATHDVGATSPYEAGSIFIVGTAIEAGPKNKPAKRTLSHQEDISGNPQYDAATANWGPEWRTPTYAEWSELMGSCTWVFETLYINDKTVEGHRIIGPNGNSIFMLTTDTMQSLCSTPNTKKKGKMWVFAHIKDKKMLWTPGKHPYYCLGTSRPVRDK